MAHKTEGRYRAEVIADRDGKFCGNALRFDTVDEAVAYAEDLAGRWTLVRAWRVVDGTDEATVASGTA
jgi:hypothetical protein